MEFGVLKGVDGAVQKKGIVSLAIKRKFLHSVKVISYIKLFDERVMTIRIEEY